MHASAIHDLVDGTVVAAVMPSTVADSGADRGVPVLMPLPDLARGSVAGRAAVALVDEHEVFADPATVLRGIAADLGLPITSRTDYSRQPDPTADRLLAEISANLDRIEVDAARPGDVLLFWFDAPDRPYHFGVLTDVGLIHTYTRVRRVVEHGLSADWRARIHSAWRIRGPCSR